MAYNIAAPPAQNEFIYLGNKKIRASSAVNQLQLVTERLLLPRSAPASTCLQSGTTDIIWDINQDSGVDLLTDLQLRLTLANSDGSNAMAVVDGFSLVDYWILECNGVQIQGDFGQSMRKIFALTTPQSQLAVSCSAVGLNSSTFVASNAIGTSSNVTIYVPIKTLLSAARVELFRPNTNFRLTIRTISGANCVLSTSAAAVTALTVSNVALVAQGLLLGESIRHKRLQDRSTHTYRYLDVSRDTLSYGSLTSGTVATANYQNSGMLAFAFLDLQSTAAAQETLYTPSAITAVDVLSNGQVINSSLGDNSNLYTIVKALASHHWSNTAILAQLNEFYVTFTENPEATVKSSANHGFRVINGNTESVRINPGATIASARVNWYGYWYAYIDVDGNGHVNVSRNAVHTY
jgi:hypothetical protein